MIKKLSLLVICISFYCFTLSAQTYRIQVKPLGQQYWGYCDLNGKLVIPPIYERNRGFSEDGFAVALDRSTGDYRLINAQGIILDIAPSKYKLMTNGFSNGLAAVRVGGLWGFIGMDGKYVYPPMYKRVTGFNDGFAIAEVKKTIYIIDTKGKTVQLQSEIKHVKGFSEGLAAFQNKKNQMGFIDTLGNIAIPAKYYTVGDFSGGLAWIRDFNNNFGYINSSGEMVVGTHFEAAKDFDPESGMAKVRNGDLWGFVNTSEEFKVFNSTICKDFSEGLSVGKINYRVGFLNNEGDWEIEPKFLAARRFRNGYAAAKGDNELWGLINKHGDWVIRPQFSAIMDVVVIK